MTALSANFSGRNAKVRVRHLITVPVNAGDVIYVGAYVCREAATALATPGADTANVVPLGVAVEAQYPDDPANTLSAAYDNTNGADGTFDGETAERCVRVDQANEYAFAVSAGTPLPGAPAYLVDDNTVSANATTNSIIAGHFTQAAPTSGQWFIDISRRGIA